MPLVTLTTDWWKQDYQALVMGQILSHAPEARFVEITRQVKPFQIVQAAYFLRQAWTHFPKGTIHLFLVDPEISVQVRPLLVICREQFFIGPDNGVFSLLFGDEPTAVFERRIMMDDLGGTFPELLVFADLAGKLAAGNPLEQLVSPASGFRTVPNHHPAYDADSIKGVMWWIDSYGNGISTIGQGLFQRIGRGRPFQLFVGGRPIPVNGLSEKYSDVGDGEAFCLFNHAGLFETGIRKQPAKTPGAFEEGDQVALNFLGEGG